MWMLMSLATVHYLTNLLKLLRGGRVLDPLVVSFCVTPYCNLNCTYCEDFGARRNPAAQTQPLPLNQAKRLLSIIRRATDHLIFTGGEPLLYPDFEVLMAYARRELRFQSLTLLTNASLLPEHIGVLSCLDRLVISLDTTDPRTWDRTLRAAPGTAQTILDTIASIARNSPARLRLIVHCVLTPETLGQAQGVLDFSIEHNLLFSCSPQSVNNWPRYELMVSEQYTAFITRLIDLKQRGAPILGSLPYLRLMLDLQPYPCYPLLVPRVMPDGTLAYPCRPIERGGGAHGGRVNLLNVGDWGKAVRLGASLFGLPPLTCGSCYQQCYVEPSLMQARPLDWLREVVSFSPSRRADIRTYAPG
jgi:MoaA/NifB/PqqE/SkfB family radical SAM enzyme